ncbi:protein spinster homolog 1-like isoform X2 [Gallus gallus]|uniref:protein spinster homolog 1-like isoform X1 n=1 Tax=Gallus gallus TaxID=9031 RepID=UPI001AE901DD|nr:protein spinster homolog 1-like isoform X1 [Gallus gallus]XP_040512785.1 protein spinster homolog 1-like isoform X2 [Gallus gallus]
MPPYPSPQLSDALRSRSPFSYGAELSDALRSRSPFSYGAELSDALRSQSPFSYGAEVRSLQRALLLTPFVAAVGGGCFLGTALSLSRDRLRHEPPVSAEDSDGDIAVPRGGQTTKVTV